MTREERCLAGPSKSTIALLLFLFLCAIASWWL